MPLNLPTAVAKWVVELIREVEEYFSHEGRPGKVYHGFPEKILDESFDVRFTNPMLPDHDMTVDNRNNYVTVTYDKLGLLKVVFSSFNLNTPPGSVVEMEYVANDFVDENGVYWPYCALPGHIFKYLTAGNPPVSYLWYKSNHGVS